MKQLLLILLLITFPVLALQNGDFSGANQLNFTGQSVSITDYRIEFRLSNFALDAGKDQGVFGNNNTVFPQCVIPGNSLNLRCRDWAGTASSSTRDISNRPDIRVRFQRTGLIRTMEIWNADGSGYTLDTLTGVASDAFNFNTGQWSIGAFWLGSGSECNCDIGFIRFWSSTVALQSPVPPDLLVVTPANLANFELEGNITDTSVNNNTATMDGGSLSYTAAVLFPPTAVISNISGCRASVNCTISGTTSSSLVSDEPLTYFWNSTAWAKVPPKFSDRSIVGPNLNIGVSQTVTVTLRVTDVDGQIGLTSALVGAAATDANGIVLIPSAGVDLLIGPLLRSGAAAWPWFDTTEQQLGDAIGASITETPGDTVLVGTIALTNGSTTVTGTDTTFQATFNCNGSDLIMIHYPLDGGGTGRRLYTVNSCSSQTSLTVDVNYDASAGTPTGVSYGKTTNAETAQWMNGSNNWNYYDAVMAFYRLYYRTGNETYRTSARNLADKWYKWPFDGGRAWSNSQGYWLQAPRLISLLGLMLRADDGKPEYWPAIVAAADYTYVQWNSNWFPWASTKVIGDVREQGYVSLFQAGIAALHPDSATRASALANSNAAFNNFWKPAQSADGGWNFELGVNQFYSGTGGTLPWQTGFAASYLTLLHRMTGNSEILDVMQTFANFMDSYGIDPLNDGGHYDIFYTRCPAYDRESQGTVSVTSGSTAVTGSGTNFQSRYACDGTDRIAFDLADGTRAVHTVQSCSSNTSLTLATTFAFSNASGVRHLLFPSAGPTHGCGVCAWGTCGTFGTDPGSKTGARTLLNASHSFWGYLYAMGRGVGYKTIGDKIFAQNLGLGGPGNDGIKGHYNDVLGGGSAPSYLALSYLSKEFAFVGGASGAQPYLAWRLGTPLVSDLVTVAVSGNKTSVPGSTKLRITILSPGDTSEVTVCETSSCSVVVDRRKGTSQMLIEYLSSGDVVLASGEYIPIIL